MATHTIQASETAESTQTNPTTTEYLVTACFFACTEPNGLMDVHIRSGDNGKFHLTGRRQYFSNVGDIEEYEHTIVDEELGETAIFNVMFDGKEHGKPKCPYLVLKTVDGEVVDLERKDFINATKSVER
jgi:hypothetical protein